VNKLNEFTGRMEEQQGLKSCQMQICLFSPAHSTSSSGYWDLSCGEKWLRNYAECGIADTAEDCMELHLHSNLCLQLEVMN